MFNALFKRRSLPVASGSSTEISFGPCIFCAGQIAETERDPLSLEVCENRGRSVVWFAHSLCLAQRIAPALGEFTDPERADWLQHAGDGRAA